MRFIEIPALITEDIEDPSIVDITEPITVSISGTTMTIDGGSKVSGEATVTLTGDTTVNAFTLQNIRAPSLHKISIKTGRKGNFTYVPNDTVTASSVSTTTKTGSDFEILLITTNGGETYVDFDMADYTSPALYTSNALTGFDISELTSTYGATAKLYKPDGTLLTTVTSATTGGGVNFGYTESTPGEVTYTLEVEDDLGRTSRYDLPRKWISYAMETNSTPGFEKLALAGNEYTSTTIVPNISTSSKARVYKTANHGYLGINFKIQGRNTTNGAWVDIDDTGENENADESKEFLAFGDYLYHRVWVKPTAKATTTVSSSNVVTLTLSNLTEENVTTSFTGADPFDINESTNTYVFEETTKIGTVPYTVTLGTETYTNAVSATTEEVSTVPNTDFSTSNAIFTYGTSGGNQSAMIFGSDDAKYLCVYNPSNGEEMFVYKGDPSTGSYALYGGTNGDGIYRHADYVADATPLEGSAMSWDGKYMLLKHYYWGDVTVYKNNETDSQYDKIINNLRSANYNVGSWGACQFIPNSYDFVMTMHANNNIYGFGVVYFENSGDTWTEKWTWENPTSGGLTRTTADAKWGRFGFQFSRDKKYAALTSYANPTNVAVLSVDLENQTFQKIWEEGISVGYACAMSPDGKYVIAGNQKIFKNNDAGDWTSKTEVQSEFTNNTIFTDYCIFLGDKYVAGGNTSSKHLFEFYPKKEVTLTFSNPTLTLTGQNVTISSAKLYKDDVLFHTYGTESNVVLRSDQTGTYQAVVNDVYYSNRVVPDFTTTRSVSAPQLEFDGYNRLNLNNITPTSTTLGVPDGTTRDLTTQSNVYIYEPGTYTANVQSSETFAYLSNVVSAISSEDPIQLHWNEYSSPASDSSGNSLTGTLNSVSDTSGAFTFDGSSSYIQLSTSNASDAKLQLAKWDISCEFYKTGSGTVGSWIDTNAMVLITKGINAGDGGGYDINYGLVIDSNNKIKTGFEEAGSNQIALVGTTAISNNQWYTARSTFDGTILKVYLNGVLENSVTTALVPASNDAGPLMVGAGRYTTSHTPAAYFQGRIKNVKINKFINNPSLTFDGFNKLTIDNITQTSSTLEYGSNTYDTNTASNVYVTDTGEYKLEARDANTFVMSNVYVGAVDTIPEFTLAFHHGTFADSGDPYSDGSVTTAATNGHVFSDTVAGTYTWGTLAARVKERENPDFTANSTLHTDYSSTYGWTTNSGWEVSADSQHDNSEANYGAWLAFDKLNETFWHSNHSNGVSVTYPAFLRIQYPTSQVIKSYTITSRNDTTNTRFPSVWKLQGYDGSSWVDIGSEQTVTTWNPNATKRFDVSDNTTAYTKYQLRINTTIRSATDSTSDYAAIAGWKLYTLNSENDVVHDDHTEYTWTPSDTITTNILRVAGGGAAGNTRSAGGGAGGLLYSENVSLSGSKKIVVGNGGKGKTGNERRGDKGYDTLFEGLTTVVGGGGAGGEKTGVDGGSSSGNGGRNTSAATAPYPSGQGNAGGTAGADNTQGAGGGGAGGVGANQSSGVGGVGLDYSSVFGTMYGDSGWFAGGGAGGGGVRAGGQGGGGDGTDTGTPSPGQKHTGGGAGGRGNSDNTNKMPDGGSGIVIIKKLGAVNPPTLNFDGYNKLSIDNDGNGDTGMKNVTISGGPWDGHTFKPDDNAQKGKFQWDLWVGTTNYQIGNKHSLEYVPGYGWYVLNQDGTGFGDVTPTSATSGTYLDGNGVSQTFSTNLASSSGGVLTIAHTGGTMTVNEADFFEGGIFPPKVGSLESVTIKKDGAAFATTTSNTVYIRDTGTYTAEVKGSGAYAIELSTVVTGSISSLNMTIMGYIHSVYATDTSGNFWVWGKNGSGELGLSHGTDNQIGQINTNTNIGTLVFRKPGIITGYNSSYIVVCNTIGECWGWGSSNSAGGPAFGNNEGMGIPYKHVMPNDASTGVPVLITQCSGGGHALALGADSNVYSWGSNSYNQLGRSGTTTSPARVTGLDTIEVVEVAVGTWASYALSSNGDLYSWGGNDNGQLGDNTSTSDTKSTPSVVATNVKTFSVQASHVIYAKNDNTVFTFGWNHSYQIGNGNINNVTGSTHYQLTTFDNVPIRQVIAHYGSTLVLTESGEYWAWGENNTNQQLGFSGNTSTVTTPTKSDTASAFDIHSITKIMHASFILTNDGDIYTHGANMFNSTDQDTTTGQTTTWTKTRNVKNLLTTPDIKYDGKNKLTVSGTNYEDTATVSDPNGSIHEIGTAKTMYVKDTGEYVFKISGTDKYVESNVYVSSVDLAGAPTKPIDFDGYNKLTLIDAGSNVSANVTYFSNTYELGSANVLYINGTGTYDLEMSGSNVFALSSNVVGAVTSPPTYQYIGFGGMTDLSGSYTTTNTYLLKLTKADGTPLLYSDIETFTILMDNGNGTNLDFTHIFEETKEPYAAAVGATTTTWHGDSQIEVTALADGTALSDHATNTYIAFYFKLNEPTTIIDGASLTVHRNDKEQWKNAKAFGTNTDPSTFSSPHTPTDWTELVEVTTVDGPLGSYNGGSNPSEPWTSLGATQDFNASAPGLYIQPSLTFDNYNKLTLENFTTTYKEWPPASFTSPSVSDGNPASINGITSTNSAKDAEWVILGADYGNGTYKASTTVAVHETHAVHGPFQMFNKVNGGHDTKTTTTNTSGEWTIELPSSIVLYKYSLHHGNNQSTSANYPKDWTIEGSNDGTTWVVLDTRSNETYASSVTGHDESKREYSIVNNTTKYKHYKLNVSAINSGSYILIGAWKLFEKNPRTAKLTDPNGDTYSLGHTQNDIYIEDTGEYILEVTNSDQSAVVKTTIGAGSINNNVPESTITYPVYKATSDTQPSSYYTAAQSQNKRYDDGVVQMDFFNYYNGALDDQWRIFDGITNQNGQYNIQGLFSFQWNNNVVKKVMKMRIYGQAPSTGGTSFKTEIRATSSDSWTTLNTYDRTTDYTNNAWNEFPINQEVNACRLNFDGFSYGASYWHHVREFETVAIDDSILPPPSLTYDTYNKLSIENITPISTSLRLGSNTYDIGTASNVYIEHGGTYKFATGDANTFALVSNVVSGSVGSRTTLSETSIVKQFIYDENGYTNAYFSEGSETQSIRLSSDGLAMALGEGTYSSSNGRLYYYERSSISDTFTKTHTFDAVSSGLTFGASVDMNAAKTRIAISGSDADTNAANAGRVYIYDRASTSASWPSSPTATITPPASTIIRFGHTVNMSDDGLTMITSGDGTDSTANKGGVYVYEYASGSWSKTFQVTQNILRFGYKVAMNKEGTRFIAGGTGTAYYVYHKVSGTWSSTVQLTGATGYNCGMSPDGNTVAVGIVQYSSNLGRVAVYKYSGGSWGSATNIDTTVGSGIYQIGNTPVFNNDGTLLVTGCSGYNSYMGCFEMWKYESGSWVFKKQFLNPTVNTGEFFGSYLSMDYAGTSLIVSDTGNDVAGENYGRVVLYGAESPPSLTYDTSNKLSIENLTPTSTTLTDPNGSSFDIGTASNVYIRDSGTYSIASKDANTFALTSTTVTGTPTGTTYVYDSNTFTTPSQTYDTTKTITVKDIPTDVVGKIYKGSTAYPIHTTTSSSNVIIKNTGTYVSVFTTATQAFLTNAIGVTTQPTTTSDDTTIEDEVPIVTTTTSTSIDTTLAFHYGSFDTVYGDADVTEAANNGHIFDDTPSGTYDWGTLGTPSTASNQTTYTWTPSSSITGADVLMVAGGGGGGKQVGGGGGAGGLLHYTNQTLSGQKTIVVGDGGIGGDYSLNVGASNGNNTTFTGFDNAIAGGRGASYNGFGSGTGGSGGGGGGNSTTGQTGTSGQGNNGGSGRNSNWAGGGGGGAGAAGQGSPSNNVGGYGGAGLNKSSVFGTTYGDSGWFAGGGGGCGSGTNTVGAGGQGGGGQGGNTATVESGVRKAGTKHTGGGGGGTRDGNNFSGSSVSYALSQDGGKGGSGIVLVKYTGTITTTTTTGGLAGSTAVPDETTTVVDAPSVTLDATDTTVTDPTLDLDFTTQLPRTLKRYNGLSNSSIGARFNRHESRKKRIEKRISIPSSFSAELTANNASSPTTLTVTVSNSKFVINGDETPTLGFIRGETYTFDQSDASNSGHPLVLATSADGTQYTTGWTASGTPGTDGSHAFIVPYDVPDTIYYKCNVHPNMGGEIHTTFGNAFSLGDFTVAANTHVSGEYTLATNYDGTTSNLYVNGFLITQTTPTISAGVKEFILGKEFDGYVKNFKFWNRILVPKGIPYLSQIGSMSSGSWYDEGTTHLAPNIIDGVPQTSGEDWTDSNGVTHTIWGFDLKAGLTGAQQPHAGDAAWITFKPGTTALNGTWYWGLPSGTAQSRSGTTISIYEGSSLRGRFTDTNMFVGGMIPITPNPKSMNNDI